MILLTLCGWLPAALALAVPMVEDPKGFHGVPWGAPLADHPDLVLVQEGSRSHTYEFKEGPPTIGEIPVDSLKLETIERKFARVTIRFQGKATHERLLGWLEQRYGPLDRTPGQTMAGVNQEFDWRGQDTLVRLQFLTSGERGFLFIESRALAPKYLEQYTCF